MTNVFSARSQRDKPSDTDPQRLPCQLRFLVWRLIRSESIMVHAQPLIMTENPGAIARFQMDTGSESAASQVISAY